MTKSNNNTIYYIKTYTVQFFFRDKFVEVFDRFCPNWTDQKLSSEREVKMLGFLETLKSGSKVPQQNQKKTPPKERPSKLIHLKKYKFMLKGPGESFGPAGD